MSDVIDHTVLGGRVPLPQLIRDGTLPYQTERQAKVFLDRLRVPYIIICRLRHYRPADIRQAIDHETRAPRVQRRHVREHEPETAAGI